MVLVYRHTHPTRNNFFFLLSPGSGKNRRLRRAFHQKHPNPLLEDVFRVWYTDTDHFRVWYTDTHLWYRPLNQKMPALRRCKCSQMRRFWVVKSLHFNAAKLAAHPPLKLSLRTSPRSSTSISPPSGPVRRPLPPHGFLLLLSSPGTNEIIFSE